MSVFSRTLTHTQFWVQVWGLPFDLITPKIGTLVGNSMGRYLLVDGRTDQSKQAQFLRVKVEFPLHKPLHRGGHFTSPEGERYWADYRYERLLFFCFRCGLLRHEARHCPSLTTDMGQYGVWLRAGGASQKVHPPDHSSSLPPSKGMPASGVGKVVMGIPESVGTDRTSILGDPGFSVSPFDPSQSRKSTQLFQHRFPDLAHMPT